MANKEIFQIISDYCQQIKYGEIFLRIKVHQGDPVEIDETQPPLRKFRAEKKA